MPVHTDNDRDDYGSHRPVNLTSNALKFVESALNDRVVNHLQANKLAMVKLHVFWHKRLSDQLD